MTSSLGSAAARLYWMFFGNIFLVLLGFGLLLYPGSLWLDLSFFGVAASILLIRALDTLALGGTSADGRPATATDVRRHALVLLTVSAIVWVAAKAAIRGGLV